MARRSQVFLTISLTITLLVLSPMLCQAQNIRPVADAGSSRYAGPEPIALDGTGSYDPDNSGTLSYIWRQIEGPAVFFIDANTATPTITGPTRKVGRNDVNTFIQTEEVQECEFELIVSDGELTSTPNTVKVTIVPNFGLTTLEQENPPFDSSKPTIIFFGGGDCFSGYIDLLWSDWHNLANIISFPNGYVQDIESYETWHTYYHYGDMIIVYLSKMAPEYTLSIQTIGWSTGGQPAVDVGIRMNQTYEDSRYTVNRVTELDAPCRWRFQSSSIYDTSNALYQTSAVDGEQCWHDHYWGDAYLRSTMTAGVPRDLLCIYLEGYNHTAVVQWYKDSLRYAPANEFNQGVIAGAYWSVVGPGKNLQLTQQNIGHYFHWLENLEQMDLFDSEMYPGRLPEPVTLVGPENDALIDEDGAVFSCEESENAVGYQLLFGSDQYRVMDYIVVSDTPNPPEGTISQFPFEKTWWTVRAYDSFGSTIYADPRYINAEVVSPPPVLPHILYIYDNDIAAAESFQSLLTDYCCSADLIDIADVATAPLNSYDLIIVGNDTGSTADWGSIESVAVIEDSGKPVLGLGEAGYAFFGKLGLSIGWPNGMHGDDNSLYAIDPNSPLFSTPYPIKVPEDGILHLYSESSLVTLYLSPVPETVTVLGRSAAYSSHYTLALEHDRYLFWGFTESPQKMTEDGKRLFINIVTHTANMDW